MSAFFCADNITGDIENFGHISILLNKTKIVEIGTKLRAQENQINNSRILLQNLVYEEMS